MAKDIDIVIGAKNQASSIMAKVGKDARSLGGSVQRAAKESVSATKKMESGFTSLKAAAGPLLAAFAAFKAATAGFRIVGEAAAAFDVQEEAVRGLTTALELSGSAVGPTIEQHMAFASALQQTANVGDEVTLGLMKQASMLGVQNDQLQDVTTAAIGLSEATGQGLESSLRLVQRAIEGDTGALARYLPLIRTASTEEEKLAIIMNTASKGLKQKEDRSNTAAGSAERLSNTWGDFLEVVGKALEPVRMLVNNGLNLLVEVIQSFVIPAIAAITPSVETMKSVMDSMRTKVMQVVTMVEVVVGNLGTVFQMAKDAISLQVLGIMGTIQHAFTVAIPEYAAWFGRNFVNLLTDAFNLATTVVQNYVKNAADILLRLWDFIASGMKGGASSLFSDIGEIAGRSLTDGFKAVTESLPSIAERQLTETEKVLQARLGNSSADIAKQYQEKLAERMKASGKDAGEAFGEGLSLGGSGGAAGAGSGGTGTGAQSQTIQSSESRLLVRGRAETTQEKIQAALEKAVGLLTQISSNTEDDYGSSESPGLEVQVIN